MTSPLEDYSQKKKKIKESSINSKIVINQLKVTCWRS